MKSKTKGTLRATAAAEANHTVRALPKIFVRRVVSEFRLFHQHQAIELGVLSPIPAKTHSKSACGRAGTSRKIEWPVSDHSLLPSTLKIGPRNAVGTVRQAL